MTMIRKQFFIDREQSNLLRRLAASKGVSEGELIRLGVDKIIAEQQSETEDWKRQFARVMEKLGDQSALATRVEQTKKLQSERWRARIGRSRKRLERI